MSSWSRIEVSPGRWTRLRLADLREMCGCGITCSGSVLPGEPAPQIAGRGRPRTWLTGLGRPRLALGHVFGTATRTGPLLIAYSCTRRRLELIKPAVRLRRSAGVCASDERRVWDSNPRGSSRPLAVFKTGPVWSMTIRLTWNNVPTSCGSAGCHPGSIPWTGAVSRWLKRLPAAASCPNWLAGQSCRSGRPAGAMRHRRHLDGAAI